MALALVASLISIRLGVSVALAEILMGVIGGNFLGLHTTPWIDFLATFGSGVLTFLAGAEIDPASLRRQLKPSLAIGVVSFAAPFAGAWAFAELVAGWDRQAAQIAGVALSTTSVAVVYAVMVETGLNQTELGKLILAACFITDFGTVLALGVLFANFNIWMVPFVAVTAVLLWYLPRLTRLVIANVGNRVSEPEIKFLFLVLFVLGGLATTAKSEAVLPAYLVGLVIAGVFVRDRTLVHRMRSIAFALLTPFYFLKAGLFISLPAVLSGLGLIAALLAVKMATKLLGVWPVSRGFHLSGREANYTSLLMATGLTFGSISALFGLTNGLIDQAQYTILVTVVILSAIVPTLIAQAFFRPDVVAEPTPTPLATPIAGFGSHSRIHTARLVDIASPLPLVVTWVDAPDRVERLLPAICDLVKEGLIIVEDVQIAKYSHRDLPALRSSLTVGDLMTRDVTAVRRDTPLSEVVELLVDRDFRAVPVVEESGRVAGIITNADLVRRAGLPARLELLAVLDQAARRELVAAMQARTAEEIMTHPPVFIAVDAAIELAAELMLNGTLKRLPVLDPEGRLLGMISRADLLRALGEGYPLPQAGGPAPSRAPQVLADVMTRDVPVVREDARLAEVLDVVVSTRLNRAVVIDAEGRVKGVISDADVLKRLDPQIRWGLLGALMRRGRVVPEEAARTTAAEMMSRPALTGAPDTPIDEAARRMVEARRKVLPIVDEQGVLLGIVDRAQLLAAARSGGGGP